MCFAILEGDGDTGIHGKFAPFYRIFGSLDLRSPKASMEQAVQIPELAAGQKVRHARFGEGTVKAVDAAAGRVTVAFDAAGGKTLATRLAKLEVIR